MNQQSGKALFPFIIIVLVVVCSYLYLPHSQGQSGPRQAGASTVSAHTVTRQERVISVNSIGTARANHAINVRSAQSDYISEIYFEDGDTVKLGAPLVQLKNTEEKLDIQALKVTLKEEKRQLQRLKELARTQATARSQLDAQAAKVDTLTAQLEATKTKLQELTIYAPFSGVLGQRQVSVGSFVNSNSVITTLDDISVIKVDFQIPEKYLATIRLGLVVNAQSDAYPDLTFFGKVTHIDPRIDEATRSVKVTASFDNQQNKLRPGMLLHVAIELEKLQALMVPEKSIIPRQDKHFVFLIDPQSTVKLQQITVKERFGEWVAITDGLAQGDQVVTEGTLKIRSGSKVAIKG
ncbi:efflux RND transporter periplasmic adaptor subunit [Pseudoalteromonas sp. T1lg65]|uniref:efflux RND transporter periplasmic adaptor subunit n=1 Tax=Pseudoalteromonas sp. T1lg65 TaxID=2077101 RepID=UPI003F7A0EA6